MGQGADIDGDAFDLAECGTPACMEGPRQRRRGGGAAGRLSNHRGTSQMRKVTAYGDAGSDVRSDRHGTGEVRSPPTSLSLPEAPQRDDRLGRVEVRYPPSSWSPSGGRPKTTEECIAQRKAHIEALDHHGVESQNARKTFHREKCFNIKASGSNLAGQRMRQRDTADLAAFARRWREATENMSRSHGDYTSARAAM